MKPTTGVTFAAITALAVGCSLMSTRQRSSSTAPGSGPVSTHDVTALVEAGIEAYNNGDIAAAKTSMEAVLRATRERPMRSTRARAHFYLAALGWDVGDVGKTNDHLRQCRLLQPLFEPDWTFIAPNLRKHYENLSVKIAPVRPKPAPRKPVPEKTPTEPAPPTPAPEKPAAKQPATEKPATEKPATTKPAPPQKAAEPPAPAKPGAAQGGAQKPAAEAHATAKPAAKPAS